MVATPVRLHSAAGGVQADHPAVAPADAALARLALAASSHVRSGRVEAHGVGGGRGDDAG